MKDLTIEQIQKDYSELYERICNDFKECDQNEIRDICQRCIEIDEEADLIY